MTHPTPRLNPLFTADLVNALEALAVRWADEHDYEDIREYADVIRPLLPPQATLTRMVARPFGFTGVWHSRVTDTPFRMTVQRDRTTVERL
jgi:hypothetical protein